MLSHNYCTKHRGATAESVETFFGGDFALRSPLWVTRKGFLSFKNTLFALNSPFSAPSFAPAYIAFFSMVGGDVILLLPCMETALQLHENRNAPKQEVSQRPAPCLTAHRRAAFALHPPGNAHCFPIPKCSFSKATTSFQVCTGGHEVGLLQHSTKAPSGWAFCCQAFMHF